MNAIPIPVIIAVSVVKLAPLPRFYHGNTVVPIPMQLSTVAYWPGVIIDIAISIATVHNGPVMWLALNLATLMTDC